MNGGLTAESDSTAERNIVALATLYFPSEQNAANARLIAQQVSEVILLDNTPGADNSALFSDIENAKYIANGRNLGLSAAFNRCMDFDEVKTSDFLVFFDQDSEVVPGQMETLAHDFEVLEQNHKVGCLGPVFLDTNKNKLRGKEQTSTPAENNCWHVTAVITSSCMTRWRILERVGFWNEHVFLDYADMDLCWRLVQAGYENFVTERIRMRHCLGCEKLKVVHPFRHTEHELVFFSPMRIYYETRDGLRLMSKPYVPARWRAIIRNEFLRRTKDRLMFLGRKGESLKYFLRGLADSLCGVEGEMKAKKV